MFDFNTAKEDIGGNTQPLVNISNRAIWDTMLMSEKLKYLMGINNFAAIMKHGDLLKHDSPNKITICINIYKATREKQLDLISTMYYKMYYMGKDTETFNDSDHTKTVIFKLLDSVTIRYSFIYNDSDIRTTSYEIIETDYEKLKINLFDTQTFLKN